MLINNSPNRGLMPSMKTSPPESSFQLAQAGLLTGRTPPPAQQTSTLPDAAATRIANLLGTSKTDKASMSFEMVNAPQLQETGGVLVQDGQIFAIVNRPRVAEQAQVFGLDPARLGLAIAEQEVAQKIIQSNSKFSGLSSAQEEVVGEAAYLNSYPDGAIRTLERSAIALSGGGSDNYGQIAEVTAKAMGEALRSTARNPGSRPISGEQALAAFDAFIQKNGSSFSNSSAPYKDAFESFAKETLGVANPTGFRGLFDRTMQNDFNAAAKKILN